MYYDVNVKWYITIQTLRGSIYYDVNAKSYITTQILRGDLNHKMTQML